MDTSARPDVLLHVGLPKTGTTSVQAELRDNAELLRAHGWRYGTVGRGEHPHHLPFINAFGFSPSGVQVSDRAKRMAENLHREMEEGPGLIISHEGMCRFPYQSPAQEEAFRGLFEGRRVQVLIYLRRHDLWLESLYAQFVRRGSEVRPIAEVAKQVGRPYQGFATSYRAVIDFFAPIASDPSDVTVRLFDRATMVAGDAVADFLDVLGIPPSSLGGRETSHNPSLSAQAVALTRAVVRELEPRPGPDEVERFARTIDRFVPEPSKVLMAPDVRADVLERTREERESIASRYLRPDERPPFLADGGPHPGGVLPLKVGESVSTLGRALAWSLARS